MRVDTFRLLAALALAGCSGGTTPAAQDAGSSRPTRGVLATVNGRPISEADVRIASQAPGAGHGAADAGVADPAHQANVLETLIRDELIAQRAEALDLDRNPEYQAELAARQAQLDAFRRSRLAELYEQQQRQRVSVTDAEARRYFEENSARLRTEVHVWQILVRDEARVEQARREIAAGTPFDQVARMIYPSLPADQTPWDLGFLRWNQVPEAWRDVVYDLQPGQTSGVIRGARNRFWIVRLVEKREDPQVTFETSRSTIVGLLREERLLAQRTRTGEELRRGARIVYTRRRVEPGASGEQR